MAVTLTMRKMWVRPEGTAGEEKEKKVSRACNDLIMVPDNSTFPFSLEKNLLCR